MILGEAGVRGSEEKPLCCLAYACRLLLGWVCVDLHNVQEF